jgi:hypothetical protein
MGAKSETGALPQAGNIVDTLEWCRFMRSIRENIGGRRSLTIPPPGYTCVCTTRAHNPTRAHASTETVLACAPRVPTTPPVHTHQPRPSLRVHHACPQPHPCTRISRDRPGTPSSRARSWPQPLSRTRKHLPPPARRGPWSWRCGDHRAKRSQRLSKARAR